MTEEYQEHRDRTHRGRRSSDQILEGWTWGRVIRLATALTLLAGIYGGMTTFFAARFASRQEIEQSVQPVVDTLRVFKAATAARLDRVEERQDQAEDVHQLLIPMARLQCLQLQRWQSGTLATAAGLPCDSLLRRLH